MRGPGTEEAQRTGTGAGPHVLRAPPTVCSGGMPLEDRPAGVLQVKTPRKLNRGECLRVATCLQVSQATVPLLPLPSTLSCRPLLAATHRPPDPGSPTWPGTQAAQQNAPADTEGNRAEPAPPRCPH